MSIEDPQFLSARLYIRFYRLRQTRPDLIAPLLQEGESVWTFTSGTEEVQVFVDGNIKSELGESIRSSALAGLGISLHPAFMVANDIHEGRLIHLLTAWSLPHMSIQAVYPSNRHLPTRTRMLLDFLRDWFFTRDNFR